MRGKESLASYGHMRISYRNVILFLLIISVCNLVLLKIYLNSQIQRASDGILNQNSSVAKVPPLLNAAGKGNAEKPYLIRNLTNYTKNLLQAKNVQTTKNTKDKKWTKFRFSIDTDIVDLVSRYKRDGNVVEKPVFPYSYDLKYDHIERCSGDGVLFIFLIKSAVENVKRRNDIRMTWASDVELKKHNAIRKFLVGTATPDLDVSVEKENDLHKDIIKMSFRDNYYNNTLKTIGGIHWVAQHCNRSKFLINVDDDIFVATSRLSQYLRKNIKADKSFYGGYRANPTPWRINGSKWYVSKKDYPYDVYPDLLSAGFTIMSMPFVIDVHIASLYTKKFIFDDCYLGIVAYRLRVQPKDIPLVKMWYVKPRDKFFKTLLAAHGYVGKKLKEAWEVLKRIH